MARLSVNINKIATLRNARGGNVPDLIKAAADIERFGAEGITVHPRPDERHIRKKDVYALKEIITTEFNIEGYPSRDFLELVRDVLPDQATLVPDPPDVLTSNAGWDTAMHQSFLRDVIAELKSFGIRTSLFLAPDEKMVEFAVETGTDRIELYTENFAREFPVHPEKAVQEYVQAAKVAARAGLGLNAGHDLNLDNLRFFRTKVPGLLEVSIGHALISDALYYGLENTVQLYLRCLRS
ncbi:MAG TPA: pyridoxine 5'-phosphate synthase [Bacteroidia bacterium]|nr:pyridoxine 5'-phosphate synthase [Bacteroidia bacterium]